jgi:hypothetical protein
MALSAAQELAEHELRIEQMQTNIEKMRADMRMEFVRIGIQLFLALAVAAASGAAVMNYLDHRAVVAPAAATRG